MRKQDKNRILAKLDEMQGYISELKSMLPAKEEYYKNLTKRRACEKTLELAIEALISVAALIVSLQRFGLPESEEGLIDSLVNKKVITANLGEGIKDMKGFRNILVHRYGTIDNKLVYEFLTGQIEDFNEFENQIKEYLKNS